MDISISLQEFASLIEQAVENGFLAGEQCATRPDEMLTEAQARREFEGFVDFSRAGLYKKTTSNRRYRLRSELVKERAKRNIRNLACEMVYRTTSRKNPDSK